MAYAAPAAQAQLFKDSDARQAIADLSTRVQTRADETNAALAQLLEQLSQLRKSLGELSTQVESLKAEQTKLKASGQGLAGEIATLQKQQADTLAAVETRLGKVEPQKVTVDGREFLASPDEMRLYDQATALMRSLDFDGASSAYGNFVKRFPSSGYENSVRFWWGNALFGRKDYRESLNVLRAFVAAAPDHPRAPAALLAISNCHVELKNTGAARKAIEELLKAYPESEAAAAAKERLALLR